MVRGGPEEVNQFNSRLRWSRLCSEALDEVTGCYCRIAYRAGRWHFFARESPRRIAARTPPGKLLARVAKLARVVVRGSSTTEGGARRMLARRLDKLPK